MPACPTSYPTLLLIGEGEGLDPITPKPRSVRVSHDRIWPVLNCATCTFSCPASTLLVSVLGVI